MSSFVTSRDLVTERISRLFAGGEGVEGNDIRRLVSVLRLVAAVTVVAASPLAEHQRWSPEMFGYAVAFGWIPAVGVAEFVHRRRPGRVTDGFALLVDFSLSLGLMTAFPDAAPLVVGANVLVVAYYAYVCGWRCGTFAGVIATAVVELPAFLDASVELPDITLAVYPVFITMAVVLLATIRAERRRMSAVLDRALEKSDAILTGVAEAVVVTSPRGRVREWNEAATRTFGCPAGAAVASHCAEVLGLHREIEELDCTEGCALLTARLESDDDLRVWRKNPDGDRQPLLAHVSPLLDGEGRLVEVVHSFRDITKLVQADEAKTMFLATASHELKTPLTVIMGYSELMLRQPDLRSEAREQGLKAVHERARQLTGIVDRILMSSRIEAGRIELACRPTDVLPVLGDGVAMVGTATGHAVELDAAPGVPDALADPDAVRTILDHLLDNADKYSGRQSPILVRLGATEDRVVFTVTDQGIGMGAEERDHCFDRFWQAESGDVRRFGGTGIGLYIVKSLAEAMHGDVEADSVPGEGSTFTVSLPRADRVPAAPEPVTPDARPEPSIIREFMRQVGVAGPGGGS